MENSLYPKPFEEPSVPSDSRLRSFLGKFIHNKYLLAIFVISTLSLGMGTYIILAPSKKLPIPAPFQFIPLARQSATATPAPATAETPPTSAQTASSTTPSPTLTPAPTINPGANWRMYSNTKYGYSIKYPPDWIPLDLGALEPKIPNYTAFNPSTASSSSRYITISVSTRSYAEQLALGSSSSPITVAGIAGTKQSFQDSNGKISTAVILPRTNTLLILRAKTEYLPVFDAMLSTLKLTN